MSDTSTDLYRRAMTLDSLYGLVMGFKKDLKDFKKIYRGEYRAARNIAAIRAGEGFN